MQVHKDSTTFHSYLKQASPPLHRITQILWTKMSFSLKQQGQCTSLHLQSHFYLSSHSTSMQLPGQSTNFQLPSHHQIRHNITSTHQSSRSTSIELLCFQFHTIPAFRSFQSITSLTQHYPHLQFRPNTTAACFGRFGSAKTATISYSQRKLPQNVAQS